MNVLQWYSKRRGLQKDISDATIERELREMRSTINAADPETSRQWHSVNVHLPAAGQPAPQRSLRRIYPALKPALALLSTVLVVGVVAALLLTHGGLPTYATSRGEQTDVFLADSSLVTLNHTTILTVNQSSPGGNRLVTLEGEAYFRVRGNGGVFEVATSVGTVRVLGTEFNVRVRDGRLEVAVVRGTVRVSADDTTHGRTVVLPAGTYTAFVSGGSPAPHENLPFSDYPGWIHGKIQFRRSPLGSVAAEIAARFDVGVTVNDPSVQSQTLTGSLDARNAETAVRTLCQLTGLRYRNDANGYSLY